MIQEGGAAAAVAPLLGHGMHDAGRWWLARMMHIVQAMPNWFVSTHKTTNHALLPTY